MPKRLYLWEHSRIVQRFSQSFLCNQPSDFLLFFLFEVRRVFINDHPVGNNVQNSGSTVVLACGVKTPISPFSHNHSL